MKGQVAAVQRQKLIGRLEGSKRECLKRLAKDMVENEARFDVLNYSRMHHRHNKSQVKQT